MAIKKQRTDIEICDLFNTLLQGIPAEEYAPSFFENILEGRVLLFLLGTLGETDVFKWLPGVTPKGNYYELDVFKIYRKAQKISESVTLSEYRELKEAAEILGPDKRITTLLSHLNSNGNIYCMNDFLDACVFLTAKLSRLLSRTRYLPGDVFCESLSDQRFDLIDMYQYQHKMKQLCRRDVIRDIAKRFELKEDIWGEFEYNRKSRWTQHRTNDTTHTKAGTVYFTDERDLLLMQVEIRDDRIHNVNTYWAKDVTHTPFRSLQLPIIKDVPLWNLKWLYESDPERTPVIITDSLVAAHKAFESSELNSLQTKLEAVRNPDKYKKIIDEWGSAIRKIHQQADAVEREETIPQEDDIHHKAFLLAVTLFASPDLVAEVDGVDRLLKISGKKIYLRIITDNEFLNTSFIRRQQIIKEYISNNFTAEDSVEGDFCDAFYEYWNEFCSYPTKIDELKKRYVISSWLGGNETINNLDVSPLCKRKVYFLLRDDTNAAFLTAELFRRRITALAKSTRPDVHFVFLNKQNYTFQYFDCTDIENSVRERNISIEERNPENNTPAYSMFATKINLETLSAESVPQDKRNKFVLEPLLKKGSVNMLYSPPNTGKTFLSQSIALAIACQSPLFNLRANAWKAPKALRVLYIDSEMSHSSFVERLCMLKDFYFQSKGENVVPHFEYCLFADKTVDLASEDDEHRQLVSSMLHLGTDQKIEFIVFDNLSTLCGGNDSQKSWMKFFSWLRHLSDKEGITSLCVHHSNKIGEQRGTSLRSVTLDNIIRLTRAIPVKKQHIAMTLTVEKARDVSKESLDPLPLELKCVDAEQNAWQWGSTLANGKSSLSIEERNQMVYALHQTKAFNIKIIANYLGLEECTVKAILARHKKANNDLQ